MADRELTYVFCDDVRQELGRKVTLVGVYAADILVASMPATMSKLSVWINVATSFERPLKKLAARLVRIGQPTPLLSIEDALSEGVDAIALAAAQMKSTLSVTLVLELAPYRITEPHLLQLVVEIDGAEHKSRPVNVMLADTEEFKRLGLK